MANPSAAHEPSMEEILASIRQIISEDGEGNEAKDAQAEETSPEAEAEPEHEDETDAPDEVAVELEAAAELEPAPQFDPEPEPQFEPSQEPEPEGAPAHGDFMTPQSASAAQADPFEPMAASSEEESSHRPQGDDRHLLSAQSDQAVHGAFSALAHTILAQNARTLEDLVAEMLQPMLKTWLDENLPSLVERLVQEEIQRVSRGR
jgi:cell pole-organizing protein PopZ